MSISLATVRRLFDELGKGEPLSPCCSAAVFQDFSSCTSCGGVVTMPFYFISIKSIPDAMALGKELALRAMFPKGAALVCLVNVP